MPQINVPFEIYWSNRKNLDNPEKIQGELGTLRDKTPYTPSFSKLTGKYGRCSKISNTSFLSQRPRHTGQTPEEAV